MVKRQVQQGLASYRDVDGVWRHALAGESVDVASDDLQRFDQLNAAPDYTPKEEPEPVKKTTAKKTAAPRKVARK